METKLFADLSIGKALAERRFYIFFPALNEHRNHFVLKVCITYSELGLFQEYSCRYLNALKYLEIACKFQLIFTHIFCIAH